MVAHSKDRARSQARREVVEIVLTFLICATALVAICLLPGWPS